jgi:hypothetical protein
MLLSEKFKMATVKGCFGMSLNEKQFLLFFGTLQTG